MPRQKEGLPWGVGWLRMGVVYVTGQGLSEQGAGAVRQAGCSLGLEVV